MNLLKIFTYSGIIEVFVIPHILPCIVALIPSNITDMVELGVGIVSGLFPRVTINIESEVFLRVWRDPNDNAGSTTPSIDSSKNGGNEASSSDVSTDSKSDNGSSFDEFCEPDGSTKQPVLNKGNDSGKYHTGGNNGQNKDSNQPSTSAPSSSNEFAKLNCVLNKDTSTNCHPRYTCTIEDNASLAADKLDTFCRSCSVEYYVKPPINEKFKSPTDPVSMSCKICEVEECNKKDVKNAQFCKSCSLEYVTKFDDKKNDDENKKNVLKNHNEKLVYHSLIKSPLDFKKSFADREIMTDFGLKSQQRDWKQRKISEKRETIVETTREMKPIYFGDNYKNL